MPGARAASPLLLGAHMSAAGGLDKALLRGQLVGCNCIQIFTIILRTDLNIFPYLNMQMHMAT